MNETEKVEAFGQLMIRRLDEHAEKGRVNWEDMPVESVFLLLASEFGEVADALIFVDYDQPPTVKALIDECGDLANFAMMIADNLGGLND